MSAEPSRAAAALARYAEARALADLDDMTPAELAAVAFDADESPARRQASARNLAQLDALVVATPRHRIGRTCVDGVWVQDAEERE